ncbi:MAG TPA: diguanylate cyclase, partial [Rhodocyclaceae bacterium]|nr:diguanylate cyclase [Rhodocyclaceae bacterium]
MEKQSGLIDDLLRQLVVPVFVIDADSRVIVWNRACEVLTGMSAQAVVGTREHWRAFYDGPRPCLADLIATGRTAEIPDLYASHDSSALIYGGFHAENRCVMPLRGVELYLAIDAGPVRDGEGRIVAVIETLRDLTAWKQAEEQLHLNASVFDHCVEGILITDARRNILSVNPAFTRLTGYPAEEVLGRNPGLLKSGLHDRPFYEDLWRSVKETGRWSGEVWNRRKDGEVYPERLSINVVRDAAGEITHYIGMFSDITQAKQAHDRLEDMANHDALTGLPNRIALSGRLHQAIVAARRDDRMLAVCFLDLDGFKPVNDRYGHEAGDAILVEVAGRLKSATRASDTVARIGGDEFVLLLSEFARVEEIEAALTRILRAVSRPYRVDDDDISLSASVGVTVHPLDESDSDALIRHADQAMYAAKNLGRNTWHMFDVGEGSAATQAGELLNRVRQGLQHGEFRLFYQPKVNLRTGAVEGMEALIRWQHPERGIVAPADFLPVVENTPVIIDLDEWVIHEALGQILAWATEGLPIKISVNIAARHFQHIDFIPRLRAILAQYPDVSPGL